MSRISFSIPILPLNLGSNRSFTEVSSRPVAFLLYAIPVIPDCHGRLYWPSGSHCGFARLSIKLPVFFISSSGKPSSQPSATSRAAIQYVGANRSCWIDLPEASSG